MSELDHSLRESNVRELNTLFLEFTMMIVWSIQELDRYFRNCHTEAELQGHATHVHVDITTN